MEANHKPYVNMTVTLLSSWRPYFLHCTLAFILFACSQKILNCQCTTSYSEVRNAAVVSKIVSGKNSYVLVNQVELSLPTLHFPVAKPLLL